MEKKTKLYPEWKNAVEFIRDLVKENGYGFLLSHEEIDELMDLEKPKGNGHSFEEIQKYQLKRLNYIENLYVTLLECHQICLSNIKGKGYMILNQKNQIRIEPYKYLRRAKKEFEKMRRVVVNVDLGLLDSETKKERLYILSKIAFYETLLGQKKLPQKKDGDEDDTTPAGVLR